MSQEPLRKEVPLGLKSNIYCLTHVPSIKMWISQEVIYYVSLLGGWQLGGRVQQQTHSKSMTGIGQLTRGVFIINDFLKNPHFNG